MLTRCNSCPGPLSLVLGATVLISLVQNTLLLQTEPQWQNGILHFTYPPKPLDFVRIIPVAATTVFLTALGVAAAQHDASLWPFPAGKALHRAQSPESAQGAVVHVANMGCYCWRVNDLHAKQALVAMRKCGWHLVPILSQYKDGQL